MSHGAHVILIMAKLLVKGCPICHKDVPLSLIEVHVNACLNDRENDEDVAFGPHSTAPTDSYDNVSPPTKRHKFFEKGNSRHSSKTVVGAKSVSASPAKGEAFDKTRCPITVYSKSHAWGSLAKCVNSDVQNTKNTAGVNVIAGAGVAVAGVDTAAAGRLRGLGLEKTVPLAVAGCDGNDFGASIDDGADTCVMAPIERKNQSRCTGVNANKQSQKLTSNVRDGKGGKQMNNQFVPLAERMRPLDLEHYVGQDEALGKSGSLALRLLLESHQIPSMVFWGPPGCGKV